MEHRRFGRTGLSVPALTFGGGWVGGVLIHRDRDEAFSALDRAMGAGMDWIDTAALYGDGISETVIGAWLAARPEARPGLSTKFMLDPAAPDLRGRMLASVEASLARLGRDRVPLILLHNPVGGADPRALDVAGALAAADMMETLRENGLCDHIGMTAIGDPAALAQVVDAGRFDVAQVYVNMLNPTAIAGRRPWNSTNFDGLLKRCAAQDMGVMAIRILAAGHLASETRHGREIPITEAADAAAEEARAAAVRAALPAGLGAPAQAALRFGLGIAEVSTVVVGLGEIAHLELAIAAERTGPLPPEALAALETAWADPAFTA